jgi:hypothetical protein
MPKGHGPLTDAEKARISELYEAGKSCRAIATDTGRSPSTVAAYARKMGLTFNTERTANATAAKQASNREKRATLESRFLDEAAKLLDQLSEPVLAYNFGGKDNTYEEHQLPEPDIKGKKDLIQAAGTAVDKAIKLAEADKAGAGAEAGKSMVGALFHAFRITPVEDNQGQQP